MALDINKPIVTSSPADFFGKLFQLRDTIHLRHLRPTNPGQLGSYAEHKALNDFYDELLDLIDGLAESYQGKYGLLNISISSSNSNIDAVETILELTRLIDGGRVYSMFKETWIQNELDEISKLCYQTIYKLKFLK